MNWMRRLLYGRNGIDQLSLAILIFGAMTLILAQLIRMPLVGVVYWLCMFLFFYRTLSRNTYRRREENMRYLLLMKRVRDWFRLRGRMIREARTHTYLKCPRCGQRIRAPRGKGRVVITCQKCRGSFGKKL